MCGVRLARAIRPADDEILKQSRDSKLETAKPRRVGALFAERRLLQARIISPLRRLYTLLVAERVVLAFQKRRHSWKRAIYSLARGKFFPPFLFLDDIGVVPRACSKYRYETMQLTPRIDCKLARLKLLIAEDCKLRQLIEV